LPTDVPKETITTRLAGLDDEPDLYFENLDGDKQKELFKNEYWTWTAELNKLEVRDMRDKKQEELYGRSFMKLNIVDGRIVIEVLDPQDVLVDRFIDPADIETARRITHLRFWSYAKWRLQKFNGVPTRTFYLHLKECDYGPLSNLACVAAANAARSASVSSGSRSTHLPRLQTRFLCPRACQTYASPPSSSATKTRHSHLPHWRMTPSR
jgi:transposase-like protein